MSIKIYRKVLKQIFGIVGVVMFLLPQGREVPERNCLSPWECTHPQGQLQQSMAADVCPKDRPDLSIVIDGAIGELSIFHSTFGY